MKVAVNISYSHDVSWQLFVILKIIFEYEQNKKIKIYMKKYGQKIDLNRCKTKR